LTTPKCIFLLTIALACAGCSASATPTPTAELPALTATPSPDLPAFAFQPPDGWAIFASEGMGFALAYPPPGQLSVGTEPGLATITFPPDPATNVVEETLSISGVQGAAECVSPLAEGWAPADLSPEIVELNGIAFLRQTRSGVAAGTASTWVAYTTQRDQRCVSLGYQLRTFDPANLDPTRFPTPPASVDLQTRLQAFESIVATFTWTR
jgi:hypothetical protein